MWYLAVSLLLAPEPVPESAPAPVEAEVAIVWPEQSPPRFAVEGVQGLELSGVIACEFVEVIQFPPPSLLALTAEERRGLGDPSWYEREASALAATR